MGVCVDDRIDLAAESKSLGRPLICVPVVAPDEKGIIDACAAVKDEPADIIEWRIDRFRACEDINKVAGTADAIKNKTGKPLICTFRTHHEGGGNISTDNYFMLITSLAELGAADIIDVEIKRARTLKIHSIINDIRQKGSRVIASCHYFGCTPPENEMLEVYGLMAAAGADILKLAVMPSDRHDVMKLLNVTEQVSEKYEQPVVSMSMGSLGLISRIMGGITGSVMTFASVGEASAPGQIPAGQMSELLELLRCN